MKKTITTLAVCATALSPLAVGPAFAAHIPTSATTSGAQAVCAADAMALGTEFSAETVFAAEPVGITDPVEVAGTRVETPGTRMPDLASAVVSYSNVTAAGATQLTRNGQSPNIFANDATARTVTYANSSYQFGADFSRTATFSYACQITEKVTKVTTTPGTPAGKVKGFYTNPGNGDCRGINTDNPNWGQDVGACIFTKTGDGDPAVPGTTVTTVTYERRAGLDTSHLVDQETIAPGTGTELAGGQYTFDNQNLKVQVVVCNSPTKNPGTWRAQNGYDGGLCSYATFASLGTATIPSNSLPTT